MSWKDYFYKSIIENSKKIDDKNIKITANDKDIINAQIQGSELYNLTLKKDLSEIGCDCPFAMKIAYCKHMAALLNFCEKNNNDYNINFSKDKFDLKLKIKFKQFDSDEEIKYIVSKTGCTKEQVEDYIDAENEYLDTVERVYDDKTIKYICNKTGMDENLVNNISEAEETYLIMTGLLITEEPKYNYHNKQYNDNNRKNNDFISKLNFSFYCSSLENLNKINDYVNSLENNDINKDVKTLKGKNKEIYKNNVAQILYVLFKSKDSSQIELISDELKKDKCFALQVVRADALTLQYFDKNLRDDDEVVFEAVKSNRLAFKYASERLRNNKDLAMLAVKDDGQPYSWIGKSLANDEDLALLAIENYGACMKSAGDLIKDNKEIMLKAVEKNGWNLKYASERLKDDKEIVITAVKRDGVSLEYASDRLKNDIDVTYAMLESNYKYFMYVGEKIRNNKKFVFYLREKSIKLMEEFLPYLGNDLKNNEEFIYDLTLINYKYLKYASEQLLNNKNFISKILAINERCILLTGNLILCNFDFIKKNIHDPNLVEECKLINIFNQTDIKNGLKHILLDNGYNTIDKIMNLNKEVFISFTHNSFKNNDSAILEIEALQQKIKNGITLTNKFRPVKIFDLYDINMKLYKILDRNSCLNIKDLLNKNQSEILAMKGMNKTFYNEIIELQSKIEEDIKNDLIEIL